MLILSGTKASCECTSSLGDRLNSSFDVDAVLKRTVAPWDERPVHRLVHSKCRVEGIKQSCVTEWLEQALYRTLFKQSWADVFASVSGDENGWDLLPASNQFSLEIGSGHARHGNVEDQAFGLADTIGREKFFRRREGSGGKAELSQQVRKRLAYRLVVIDYGYK
jgi:hypothetical protein